MEQKLCWESVLRTVNQKPTSARVRIIALIEHYLGRLVDVRETSVEEATALTNLQTILRLIEPFLRWDLFCERNRVEAHKFDFSQWSAVADQALRLIRELDPKHPVDLSSSKGFKHFEKDVMNLRGVVWTKVKNGQLPFEMVDLGN